MKTIKAILIGTGIWGVAVAFFTLSYFLPILSDLDQQANLVLLVTVLPLVWIGSRLYYKNSTANGFKLGATFFLVAAILDALITVPLFIIPNGGDHLTFFTDPGFWIIALELVGVAVLYYYIKIYPLTKTLKA